MTVSYNELDGRQFNGQMECDKCGWKGLWPFFKDHFCVAMNTFLPQPLPEEPSNFLPKPTSPSDYEDFDLQAGKPLTHEEANEYALKVMLKRATVEQLREELLNRGFREVILK